MALVISTYVWYAFNCTAKGLNHIAYGDSLAILVFIINSSDIQVGLIYEENVNKIGIPLF